MHYFSLDEAARITGIDKGKLERGYLAYLADCLGDTAPETAEEQPQEPGPRFVPIEEENRDQSRAQAPIIDLKNLEGIDANELRDRVRRRMAGGLTDEMWVEFKT